MQKSKARKVVCGTRVLYKPAKHRGEGVVQLIDEGDRPQPAFVNTARIQYPLFLVQFKGRDPEWITYKLLSLVA